MTDVLVNDSFSADTEVDCLIIGGGAAGLTAALAASQDGAVVLVAERETRLAGSTALSSGLIPAAETNAQALASPHLEGFKSKKIPVLIMTDAIDQFWLPMIGSFKEKKFTSITQGQINLDDLDAKTKDKKPNDKEEKEKQDKQFVDLIAQLKVVLGDQVKDIRLSSKLTDSPVCLVADDGDMDIAMEHLMAQRDSNYKGAPRILEINGDHLLIKNMKSLLQKKDNSDLVSDAGTLLFEQARLMEGKMPADPAQFNKIMNQFLLKAIPV